MHVFDILVFCKFNIEFVVQSRLFAPCLSVGDCMAVDLLVVCFVVDKLQKEPSTLLLIPSHLPCS